MALLIIVNIKSGLSERSAGAPYTRKEHYNLKSNKILKPCGQSKGW